MSTGLECQFLKNPKTREWYYVLQDYSCPTGVWDWQEYATAYGPFASEGEADEHLIKNHANPGGSVTVTPKELDEVQEKLIAEAKSPTKQIRSGEPERRSYGHYAHS